MRAKWQGIGGCVLLLAASVMGVSCDGLKPAPSTIEVHGIVQTVKGEPVTSGLVEFTAITGTPHTTQGEIAGDGTFVMRTVLQDGRKVPGVVEGVYRCTIIPAGMDQSVPPLLLPQSYKVMKDMKLPLVILVPRQTVPKQ